MGEDLHNQSHSHVQCWNQPLQRKHLSRSQAIKECPAAGPQAHTTRRPLVPRVPHPGGQPGSITCRPFCPAPPQPDTWTRRASTSPWSPPGVTCPPPTSGVATAPPTDLRGPERCGPTCHSARTRCLDVASSPPSPTAYSAPNSQPHRHSFIPPTDLRVPWHRGPACHPTRKKGV